MGATNRTMHVLSYGIASPEDLLKKLRLDADRLTDIPDPYDIFNFIVTAAVLAEWVEQFYKTNKKSAEFSLPTRQREWNIPSISNEWINDISFIPNVDSGIRRNIVNCLSICLYTANASKHFHWKDGGAITSIGDDPIVADYYQYAFTSTERDVYVEFNGENYGLKQIKGILLQFYSGLIRYFEQV